ncbi:MAG TPA: hypothetical protein VH413_01425 [Verrucomicrobiae bacterium]|jgi:hypothetical protein|nr:hypothetical protein [Verrucomicrobiae bacterium]
MILPSMMKFQLGRLVITPAVLSTASVDEICRAIDRHICGDWGDVSESVHNANESALRNGGELLSVYRATGGIELQVLTTADRLITTVHLSSEAGHLWTPERTPTELSRVTGNTAK